MKQALETETRPEKTSSQGSKRIGTEDVRFVVCKKRTEPRKKRILLVFPLVRRLSPTSPLFCVSFSTNLTSHPRLEATSLWTFVRRTVRRNFQVIRELAKWFIERLFDTDERSSSCVNRQKVLISLCFRNITRKSIIKKLRCLKPWTTIADLLFLFELPV